MWQKKYNSWRPIVVVLYVVASHTVANFPIISLVFRYLIMLLYVTLCYLIWLCYILKLWIFLSCTLMLAITLTFLFRWKQGYNDTYFTARMSSNEPNPTYIYLYIWCLSKCSVSWIENVHLNAYSLQQHHEFFICLNKPQNSVKCVPTVIEQENFCLMCLEKLLYFLYKS